MPARALVQILLPFFILFPGGADGMPPALAAEVTGAVQFTDMEKSWLEAHPIIRLAPDPSFQPIEFFDENGNYDGLGADYVRLIEKKLGISFEIVRCSGWDDVLSRMARREVDVLNAVVRTPQRERYMRFPPPYLTIPSVIIVRKNVNRSLTLEMMEGMHVVMVSGYGYVDLIKNKFPRVEIELVPDLKAALRKVSFGMADAFVGDLSTASFYIESEGIANLKVAGETDPPNTSGFAVRSDWPQLSGILEKGASLITEEERKAIFKKWVHLDSEPEISMRELRNLILVIVGAAAVIIAGFLLWNRSLKKSVRTRTESLQKEIEERNRAEKALGVSEAKFRGLVESSSDWIWEVSANGVYTYVSPQIEKILGYKPGEIIGKSPFDLMPGEEAGRVAEIFKACVLEKKPIVALENMNLHKNGQRVVLETSGNPIFNEQGEFSGYRGVDRDITRLKRYEKTIEESERKFRILFEMLPLPIAVSEMMTGRIVDVNEKLCDISKYKKNELIGKSAVELGLFSGQDREKFLSLLSESDEIKEFEMNFRGKAGSVLSTLMFAKIIEVENERYIITAVYDRTDRERLDAQQRKIRKLESIATLSGGIAHQFNNALTVVSGHVEMLQHELSDHENVQTFGHYAMESIDKLSDLTRLLHAYARGGKYRVENLNLSDFMRKVLPGILPDKLPDVTVDMDLPDDIPNINADASQLQLVISAVLNNALEAVDNHGRIHVSTGEKEVDEGMAAAYQGMTPGRYVTITVEDDGKGMDEDTKEKIFDPFFTTKFQGRGLGMAAVYGIIKNHGGYVYIDSEPGNGTRVQMYFPRD